MITGKWKTKNLDSRFHSKKTSKLSQWSARYVYDAKNRSRKARLWGWLTSVFALVTLSRVIREKGTRSRRYTMRIKVDPLRHNQVKKDQANKDRTQYWCSNSRNRARLRITFSSTLHDERMEITVHTTCEKESGRISDNIVEVEDGKTR